MRPLSLRGNYISYVLLLRNDHQRRRQGCRFRFPLLYVVRHTLYIHTKDSPLSQHSTAAVALWISYSASSSSWTSGAPVVAAAILERNTMQWGIVVVTAACNEDDEEW